MEQTNQDIELDFSLCRLPPFEHQKIGIKKIVLSEGVGLFDEMGAGKTKQTIDAAQFLFRLGLVDKVIVVAPAAVRSVWYHEELGELSKHLWESTNARIVEYHSKVRGWNHGNPVKGDLQFIVTNYEFLRSNTAYGPLLTQINDKTLLVLDESSAVKSPSAQQTKAAFKLRNKAGRVVILNGTPVANNPLDLYTQGKLINPNIFGPIGKTYFHFRAHFANMGGFQNRQVVSWKNLEDLQTKMAPYVLRRLKIDCLDLPPKLPSVVMTIRLTPATWKIYKEMRDDLVTWLSNNAAVSAPQAITKVTRLAQVCSGFIGGVVEEEVDDEDDETRPTWLPSVPNLSYSLGVVDPVQRIGSEKSDYVLDWMGRRLEEEPNFKVLLWGRFRPQVKEVADRIIEEYPQVGVGLIHGGQRRDDRQRTLELLDPRTAPKGPVAVVGTQMTGRMGLNFTAADHVGYMSNDYSLFTRLQSEDRVHRPGQTRPVNYFDFIAEGPNGQKTIEHAILKAIQSKENIAQWTTGAWISAILAE